MNNRKCPVCKGTIKVSVENDPGDMVFCTICEAEYELLSINPLRLQPLNYPEESEYYESIDENDFDERYGYW